MTEYKCYQCDICGERDLPDDYKLRKLEDLNNTERHFCSKECEDEYKKRSKQLVFEKPYACDATVRNGNGDIIGTLYAEDAKHYKWIQKKSVILDLEDMNKICQQMEKLNHEKRC